MVEPWVKPVLLLGKSKKWFYGTYIPFGTKIVFSVTVKEPANEFCVCMFGYKYKEIEFE